MNALRRCTAEMDKAQTEAFDKAFDHLQKSAPDNKPFAAKKLPSLLDPTKDPQKVVRNLGAQIIAPRSNSEVKPTTQGFLHRGSNLK
jgi:hypothetical protein